MSGNFNNIASSRSNCNSNGSVDDQLIINSDSTPPPLPPRPPQQPPYQSLIGHNRRLPYYYAQNSGYSSNNIDSRINQDVNNIQQSQTSAVTSTNYPYYAQNLPTTSDTYQNYGDFYQILENNSSNTFKSINSIIQALNSVVNVLETTVNAFCTTFQAIVSVMDRFVSLKRVLSQMVTSLAVVKFIRWILQKFLPFSTVNRINGLSIENTWNSLDGSIFYDSNEYRPRIFTPKVTSLSATTTSLAVIIGGAILIYKFLTNIVSNMQQSRRWATGESDYYRGTVLFDFSALNSSEISISTNQMLHIAPKELQPAVRGWLLASVDGQEIGLVPANYVKIHGKVSGSKYVP